MHVSSSLVLAAVAVAACVASTSKISVDETSDAEPTDSFISAAEDRSAVPVNRLLKAPSNTKEEDRSTTPVMASITLKVLPSLQYLSKKMEKPLVLMKSLSEEEVKAIEALLERPRTLPTEDKTAIGALLEGSPPMLGTQKKETVDGLLERYLATESHDTKPKLAYYDSEDFERLQNSDNLAVDSFHTTYAAANPMAYMVLDRKMMSLNPTIEEAARYKMVEMAAEQEGRRLEDVAQAIFTEHENGWKHKTTQEMFSLLQLKEEGAHICATPNLEVLRMFIEADNKLHQTRHTLLEVLVTGFGGELAVARVLTRARVSVIYEPRALMLLYELFEPWKLRITPDGLVKNLEMENKPFSFDDFNILDAYVIFYPGSPYKNGFACLLAILGDRAFAIRIADMGAPDEEASLLLVQLCQTWLHRERSKPLEVYMDVFHPIKSVEVHRVNEVMLAYEEMWKNSKQPVQPQEPKQLPGHASHHSGNKNKKGKRRPNKKSRKH
uniref:RxLR effector candidate protein n=1 Tax=Hyaloperonospora arabidopsidis (strain Emoy2) TaxID=559515 RepID=M4BXP3_HYAAE|nr:RxLR effector candidate protein [Hyaloperonospora arabidopsidis Emoy2]